MPRKRREKPLGYEPYPDLAKSQMHDLVHALNGAKPRISRTKGSGKFEPVKLQLTDDQIELRQLVQKWMGSGPDLIKMFNNEPTLAPLLRRGRTIFYPVHDGRGHLDWIPTIASRSGSSYKEQTLKDFMILITNPLWELLGGPCARCGDYYLKKVKRQKIYCSRNCGSEMTAIAAMKRRRKEEHAKKIRCAQDAIDGWSKAKRRLTWQDWVLNHTGYTARWITRAANKKDLKSPDGN